MGKLRLRGGKGCLNRLVLLSILFSTVTGFVCGDELSTGRCAVVHVVRTGGEREGGGERRREDWERRGRGLGDSMEVEEKE